MPFVFVFVVPLHLCLLGEVYHSFGFLGVLISLAMIVLLLWLIAFLEMKSDEAAEQYKKNCEMRNHRGT
mgnify:FL=1